MESFQNLSIHMTDSPSFDGFAFGPPLLEMHEIHEELRKAAETVSGLQQEKLDLLQIVDMMLIKEKEDEEKIKSLTAELKVMKGSACSLQWNLNFNGRPFSGGVKDVDATTNASDTKVSFSLKT